MVLPLQQSSRPGDFVALAEAWPRPALPRGGAALGPQAHAALGRPPNSVHLLLYRAAGSLGDQRLCDRVSLPDYRQMCQSHSFPMG